jgi:hypothetical protein
MRFYILAVAVLLVGFDHADHPPAECTDCHRADKATGHKQCFGACHAKPKKFEKKAKSGVLCAACHADSAPDYAIKMSHGTHEQETTCKGCHQAKGHKRCAPCHKETAPTFDGCDGCHVPPPPPASIAGRIPLGEWSHAVHAKKAPAAECAACHPTTDAPAPAKASCAACHAMVDRCTSCHREAPATPPPLVRPANRFSHEQHRDRIGDCATCHALDRRGEATVPGHTACADPACHAADFATMTPVTCAACHTAIEPWRALVADAPPRPTTEFGATMPHRTHAPLGLACATCHAGADGERELRPPHGHATCSGEACHGKGRATPAPSLESCDGCHRAGLVAARVQERLGAKWTVRARFSHAPHAADCTTCHATVWDVDGPPPSPEKASCRACHDGKAAFKMTGHRCAQCHGGD